jgi:hypothetical protein
VSKRKLAAIITACVALGLCGPAAAQSPSIQQYGTTEEQPTGAGVLGTGQSGNLPFTGFQAGIVLLGGAGIAATGFALRRLGRNQKS